MMLEKIIYSLLRLAFVYIFYMAMLRLAGNRLVGMGKQGGDRQFQVGTSFDLIVAFIISDLPDDIIFGSVPVAQGVVAVGTMILLHLLTSFLEYRVPAFARLVQGEAAPLVQDGKTVRENAARERIGEGELDTMLRELRIEERKEVEEAILEPTGNLSVKRRKEYTPVQKKDLQSKARSK